MLKVPAIDIAEARAAVALAFAGAGGGQLVAFSISPAASDDTGSVSAAIAEGLQSRPPV